MNGRWSKWLIVFAVLVLVGMPVFSSGEQDSSGVVPGDGDPFGKYTPAIEVSTVRYVDVNTKFIPGNPDDDSWEVNKITRRLEEELGIKIKYDWIVPQDQFNTKWNLTIASGNLPDVMRMNVRQFQELSTADAILDVTKYVDEYASPALEWLYELDEGFTRDASTVNGKLYSVPITGTSPNNTPLLWIRKDWLDRVGLEVPTTIDEFMEVARAFRNNDPDGNGKKDTYGLAMNKTSRFVAAMKYYLHELYCPQPVDKLYRVDLTPHSCLR